MKTIIFNVTPSPNEDAAISCKREPTFAPDRNLTESADQGFIADRKVVEMYESEGISGRHGPSKTSFRYGQNRKG